MKVENSQYEVSARLCYAVRRNIFIVNSLPTSLFGSVRLPLLFVLFPELIFTNNTCREAALITDISPSGLQVALGTLLQSLCVTIKCRQVRRCSKTRRVAPILRNRFNVAAVQLGKNREEETTPTVAGAEDLYGRSQYLYFATGNYRLSDVISHRVKYISDQRTS